jgi:hypothetical protein
MVHSASFVWRSRSGCKYNIVMCMLEHENTHEGPRALVYDIIHTIEV